MDIRESHGHDLLLSQTKQKDPKLKHISKIMGAFISTRPVHLDSLQYFLQNHTRRITHLAFSNPDIWQEFSSHMQAHIPEHEELHLKLKKADIIFNPLLFRFLPQEVLGIIQNYLPLNPYSQNEIKKQREKGVLFREGLVGLINRYKLPTFEYIRKEQELEILFPHLKHIELNLETQSISEPENLFKKAYQVCSLELTLPKKLNDLSFLNQIPNPKNLNNLSIKGHDAINDQILEPIIRFINLKSLRLEGCGIHDSFVSHLINGLQLEALELPRCRWLSNKSLFEIGHCLDLKSIDMSYTFISSKGLKHLSLLKNLECLKLRGNDISSGLKLLQNQSLKTLDLSNCHLESYHLEFLKRFTLLQEVDLSKNDFLSYGLHNLIPSKNLAALYLQDCNFFSMDLTHLPKFTKLEILDLSGNQLMSYDYQDIPLQLPSTLKTLRINGCHVYQDTFSYIQSLPNLTTFEHEGVVN